MTGPTIIYVLYDSEMQPRYVGKTQSIANRIPDHRRKKPWFASFAILEVVDISESWEEREDFWITYLRQWYPLTNVRRGGHCPPKHSHEMAKRIGEINRQKLTGRKHTPESIQRMKDSQNKPEVLKRNREKGLGIKMSPESSIKKRNALQGRVLGPYPQQRRDAMSLAQIKRYALPLLPNDIKEGMVN